VCKPVLNKCYSIPELQVHFLTPAIPFDHNFGIVNGRILVWEKFAFVKHSANLLEYKRVVEELDRMTNMFP